MLDILSISISINNSNIKDASILINGKDKIYAGKLTLMPKRRWEQGDLKKR